MNEMHGDIDEPVPDQLTNSIKKRILRPAIFEELRFYKTMLDPTIDIKQLLLDRGNRMVPVGKKYKLKSCYFILIIRKLFTRGGLVI